MSTVITLASRTEALATELHDLGFSPYFGTPCGILAPLYSHLLVHSKLTTIVREDNAVGLAAGSALSGRYPVVLMQNSGLGLSMNALASLITPYQLPVLLVVSQRGIDEDLTEENQIMGGASESLLADAGIPAMPLEGGGPQPRRDWLQRNVIDRHRAAALLVPPSYFGWRP